MTNLNNQPIAIVLRQGVAANINLATTYFAEGEPGYTTDTKIVYISDGTYQYPVGQVLQRTTVADVAYSVLVTDYLVSYTSLTAARTVTLPTAVGCQGKRFIVKDEAGTAGTNNITIATTSSQTIDGAATLVLSANYGKATVYSDGANSFTV